MDATISADIIHSTKLSEPGAIELQTRLFEFVRLVNRKFDGCWGRIVRGDGFECAVSDPHHLMRIVLLLKCLVKMVKVKLENGGIKETDKRFLRLGIRIAVAIGNLRINNRERKIMDGEAIYRSGRALSNMRIFDTFSIACAYEESEAVVRSLFLLVNHIMTRATARQCQAMFMRLQDVPDNEIARAMGISRIGVYLHLKALGWDAIRETLKCYESLDFGRSWRLR